MFATKHKGLEIEHIFAADCPGVLPLAVIIQTGTGDHAAHSPHRLAISLLLGACKPQRQSIP
ncbi:MAG: hypothetical protein A3I66_05065 [Burkholderiales bacterium RIFCSPLOWO2_02_FULL_57_36]|nr:MAG: hypothetical protein A3I66_05065 [Burkholderiales bacterium RIFCSPLOWO2_02_FULL_57_36]